MYNENDIANIEEEIQALENETFGEFKENEQNKLAKKLKSYNVEFECLTDENIKKIKNDSQEKIIKLCINYETANKKIITNSEEIINSINKYEQNINKETIARNKNYEVNKKQIILTLSEEKDMIYSYMNSNDLNERKKLKEKISEKEKLLYKRYNSFYLLFDNKNLQNFIKKHTQKAVIYDIKNIFNYIFKSYNNIFIIYMAFTIFLMFSYFIFQSEKIPDITLTESALQLGYVFVVGSIYLFCIFLMLYLQSYALSEIRGKIKPKVGYGYIAINFILILIVVILFYVDKIQYADIIFKYLFYCIIIFNFIFIAYCLYEINDILVAILFLLSALIDFCIIFFIYFKLNEIEAIFLQYFLILLFTARLFSFTYYKYEFIIGIYLVLTFVTLMLLSPFFVKLSGLANYEESYTIKNEFLPKSIKNLPNCFNNYHKTCVDKELSDENKTTLKNLLFRVKSDGKYYFRAKIYANDFNVTKEILSFYKNEDFNLTKRAISIFKVQICKNSSNLDCFTEQNSTINIKNYKLDFKNNHKDFHIKKENILN